MRGHFSNNKEGCDDHDMIVVSTFMFYHWVRDQIRLILKLPSQSPSAQDLPQDTPAASRHQRGRAAHQTTHSSCLNDEIISHAIQTDSCARQKVTNCRTTSTRSERRLQNDSLRSDLGQEIAPPRLGYTTSCSPHDNARCIKCITILVSHLSSLPHYNSLTLLYKYCIT
jgi:hypothetical protein